MTEVYRPQARRTINRFGTLAILALLPSIIIFGWRALVVIACVVGANVLTNALLRAPHPKRPRWPALLPVDALLLACLMPAEAAADGSLPWLGCAGVVLALLQWLRRAVPRVPFDPAVVTALLLHGALFATGDGLWPRAVLQPAHIVTGDITDAAPPAPTVEPWYKRSAVGDEPAVRTAWAAAAIDDYIRGPVMPGDRVAASLDGLIRDRLPPREDLVLLGHPMPLGQASGVFLIGVVLWGAHRRTIDWRVPLIAGATAYAGLILLAVPTSVSTEGGNWRFLAAARADVGPATAFTFGHYVAFASPMSIAIGLFASRLDARPLRGGAIVAWSGLLGLATAASALYASVAVGPLVAVAFAPMLARLADRWLARRPMRLPD